MSRLTQDENHRRDCLARYLLNSPAPYRIAFLRTKPKTFADDLRERMKHELALQIADMDENMRILRLNRLMSSNSHDQNSGSWACEIRDRVMVIVRNRELKRGAA